MTIRSKAFFLLWTAAAFTPLAAEAAAATLFVAPGGADSNPARKIARWPAWRGPRRRPKSRKWLPSDRLGGGRLLSPGPAGT